MIKNNKKDFIDCGIRVFKSRHKEIRSLKRKHSPSLHGFRVWPSSWLLVDYLRRNRLASHRKVLDIGCGWGLAGIYCAKKYSSTVTSVDSDSNVFPYTLLHAEINDVRITTVESTFEALSKRDIIGHALMIGADICFWDELMESIKELIIRALESGVENIVIADPGRPPFESLCKYFEERGRGNAMNWAVTRPYDIQGRILRIS